MPSIDRLSMWLFALIVVRVLIFYYLGSFVSSFKRQGKYAMQESNSMPQRIFIIGNGTLFDQGLAKMVRFNTTLQVSHIVYSNEVALLKLIKRGQPDLILLCESGVLDTEQILDSISINTLMIGLCIFVVHLGSYTIDAYERPNIVAERRLFRRRTIPVRAGNDLISILTTKGYGRR